MPVSPETLILLACLVVVSASTPGPDFLYISSNALSGRLSAGMAACFGIFTGLLIYATAAAFGLAALFMHLPVLYIFVQVFGVLYLGYIAWGFFRSAWRGNGLTIAPRTERNFPDIFRSGVLINLLNPKTTLFFTAFLPQFARAENGQMTLQFLILGWASVIMATIVYAVIALIFTGLGHKLRQGNILLKNDGLRRGLEFSGGILYAGFALTLALWRR
jgi:threonine/homoserine/homoserine lactone efflux protein